MNLQVLEPSRKKPTVGDVFVCRLAGRWIAGRVIRTDAKFDSSSGFQALLLYFYSLSINDPSEIRLPIEPKLLIPPELTNSKGWRIGVFQTIMHSELAKNEVLHQHCFVDDFYKPHRYFDEYLNEIQCKHEPCKTLGLGSYLTIDDSLSRAIGVPVSA